MTTSSALVSCPDVKQSIAQISKSQVSSSSIDDYEDDEYDSSENSDDQFKSEIEQIRTNAKTSK